MTFEVDCRLDNQECVVTEAPTGWRRWLRRLFRRPVGPRCRRGRVLSDKTNQYCQDRMQPRAK